MLSKSLKLYLIGVVLGSLLFGTLASTENSIQAAGEYLPINANNNAVNVLTKFDNVSTSSVVKSLDGGFFALNEKLVNKAYSTELVKTSKTGNLDWKYDIVQGVYNVDLNFVSADGGVVLTSNLKTGKSQSKNDELQKIDKEGRLLWSKPFESKILRVVKFENKDSEDIYALTVEQDGKKYAIHRLDGKGNPIQKVDFIDKVVGDVNYPIFTVTSEGASFYQYRV